MSKILKPEHTSARKPFREHLVYPLVFQMRKISPLEVNFYILQLCLTFAFKSSMALCQMNPKTEKYGQKSPRVSSELIESWHQFSSQVSKIWVSLKMISYLNRNKSVELLTSTDHILAFFVSWFSWFNPLIYIDFHLCSKGADHVLQMWKLGLQPGQNLSLRMVYVTVKTLCRENLFSFDGFQR